ncbi:hypothetical protein AVEN_7962-1 [Araneus ventricosus]|uniref:Uncharacterized protein n=1 Tax=Araneus ventricosus TaxID=182803 RepID=A0A4Y2D3I3_ARAVE|nr:hypothetical protein AVEN_7962-1 [Araneus ventricosus]
MTLRLVKDLSPMMGLTSVSRTTFLIIEAFHVYFINKDTQASDQMSSSTSDLCSKLRGASQNSPRIASKRDVNITKKILTFYRKNTQVKKHRHCERNIEDIVDYQD